MSDNYASSKTNQELLAKSEALKKIHEHSRDYLSLSLSLPLGNTALKQVHTNQWLFTYLPTEFDLANWTVIADALKSNVTRNVDYLKNRWYIESVDISVEAGGKAEMKLGLNAFASSYSGYSQTVKEMQKAYTDASTKKTTNNNNTTNAVADNTVNPIKNGWWGSWVTNLVKKTVGNETDILKRCKKMHELFRWHSYWVYYNDMQKTGGSVSKLEKNWGNAHYNCGDGANYLSAFYNCCGADAGIYLTHDRAHYIVKCVINGKTYWCDHSGDDNAHNTLRGWNQTWHGYRSGTYKGKYV